MSSITFLINRWRWLELNCTSRKTRRASVKWKTRVNGFKVCVCACWNLTCVTSGCPISNFPRGVGWVATELPPRAGRTSQVSSAPSSARGATASDARNLKLISRSRRFSLSPINNRILVLRPRVYRRNCRSHLGIDRRHMWHAAVCGLMSWDNDGDGPTRSRLNNWQVRGFPRAVPRSAARAVQNRVSFENTGASYEGRSVSIGGNTRDMYKRCCCCLELMFSFPRVMQLMHDEKYKNLVSFTLDWFHRGRSGWVEVGVDENK